MRRQQKQGFHHKRFAGQKAKTDISVSTDVRDIGLFFCSLHLELQTLMIHILRFHSEFPYGRIFAAVI